MTVSGILFLGILIGFCLIGLLARKLFKHLKANTDIYHKEYLQRKGNEYQKTLDYLNKTPGGKAFK